MSADLFEEMKAYVGFGPADEALLRGMRDRMRPVFVPLVDDFYDRIARHADARGAISGGAAQVARLKGTLLRWLEDLFNGPYDHAYYELRARIGQVHVRISLPQQYMLTAMNGIRVGLGRRARETAEGTRLEDELAALNRILDMDLAIMLHTYREDSQRLAERTERLATFGQMAASIGHELRNPLSVMESSLYLLRGRVPPGDEKITRHLDKISSQVALSNRIITSVLDAARDRAPTPRPAQLAAVVRLALEALPGAASRVEVDVPADIPAAMVDAIQVQQVVMNLVQNGLDAAGESGAVRVSGRQDEATVVLRVEDAGPGVPPLVRTRLFEPLVTTKARGVGLGLALCRKLVERNKGSIRLLEERSQLGGAVFEAAFPLATGGSHG